MAVIHTLQEIIQQIVCLSQQTFACSKSTKETLQQSMKYVQS